MRKHVEESVATGVAAGRGRGGRFSAGRKREIVVLRLLRGEDLESVSRAVGITAARASHWRAQFLAAGQAGLKTSALTVCSGLKSIVRAQACASATAIAWSADTWRPSYVREGGPAGGRRPFGPAEVDAMSGGQSISTRRAYGVQRVCRVWHRARSSVYARRQATRSPALCRRRGPIGAAPDDVLVAHIRRVLEASPFRWRGLPKSLGEAAGRGDAHLEGAGAPVDCASMATWPRPRTSRGPRTRSGRTAHDGTRRGHRFCAP